MIIDVNKYSCPSEDTKLWRYMDFTKFISLLENEALFFSRADRFIDPFEGHSTLGNNLKIARNVSLENADQKIDMKQYFNSVMQFREFFRRFTTIQCWHMNEYESAAMWDLYIKSGEGIAIQSTFGKLYESLDMVEDQIILGNVNYIDFKTDFFPYEDNIASFFYKRKSFEHENEFRAIRPLPLPCKSDMSLDISHEGIVKYGIDISCDIRNIIEKIYVSPTTQMWFYDLVKSISDRYLLDKPIIKSDLYNLP
jgi:hypothetical protein